MCENNKYAISVPIHKQLACEKVSDRAIGYGMPGFTVDGNDPIAVYEVVKAAAERGRRGEGPTLIETISYRLTPHSSDDDDRVYRSREEVDAAKKLDAIITFKAYLQELEILTETLEKELNERIAEAVNDATEYAEAAPYPSPESALKYVYAEEE